MSLPYWDSNLDHHLGDLASESILWTPEFLGNGDGFVTEGAFADWVMPFPSQGRERLFRNIQNGVPQGSNAKPGLMSDDALRTILKSRSLRDITWGVDSSFESYVGSVHNYVGGVMGDLANSPNDPIFFLNYAFIDCLWEGARLQQSANFDVRRDYPNDTQTLGLGMRRPDGVVTHRAQDSFHYALNEMRPFGPLRNIDGLSTDYAQLYSCAPRPTCTPANPTCGSEYLFCDRQAFRCAPMLKYGASCQRFAASQPCYNGMCCHGICRQTCNNQPNPNQQNQQFQRNQNFNGPINQPRIGNLNLNRPQRNNNFNGPVNQGVLLNRNVNNRQQVNPNFNRKINQGFIGNKNLNGPQNQRIIGNRNINRPQRNQMFTGAFKQGSLGNLNANGQHANQNFNGQRNPAAMGNLNINRLQGNPNFKGPRNQVSMGNLNINRLQRNPNFNGAGNQGPIRNPNLNISPSSGQFQRGQIPQIRNQAVVGQNANGIANVGQFKLVQGRSGFVPSAGGTQLNQNINVGVRQGFIPGNQYVGSPQGQFRGQGQSPVNQNAQLPINTNVGNTQIQRSINANVALPNNRFPSNQNIPYNNGNFPQTQNNLGIQSQVPLNIQHRATRNIGVNPNGAQVSNQGQMLPNLARNQGLMAMQANIPNRQGQMTIPNQNAFQNQLQARKVPSELLANPTVNSLQQQNMLQQLNMLKQQHALQEQNGFPQQIGLQEQNVNLAQLQAQFPNIQNLNTQQNQNGGQVQALTQAQTQSKSQTGVQLQNTGQLNINNNRQTTTGIRTNSNNQGSAQNTVNGFHNPFPKPPITPQQLLSQVNTQEQLLKRLDIDPKLLNGQAQTTKIPLSTANER